MTHCASFLNYNARCVIEVKRKVRHVCVMAKDDPHFRLRIPAELKVEIEQAALDHKRSINAEIIERLERSFSDDFVPQEELLTRQIAEEKVRADAYLNVIKTLTNFIADAAGRDPDTVTAIAGLMHSLEHEPDKIREEAARAKKKSD